MASNCKTTNNSLVDFPHCRGTTGRLCKFIVNTVNAGSGALAVTVDGPSKVQLNCREVEEGYEFTYTPTAPGDYLITIKYAGNTHIPGSPFRARITGAFNGCIKNPVRVDLMRLQSIEMIFTSFHLSIDFKPHAGVKKLPLNPVLSVPHGNCTTV